MRVGELFDDGEAAGIGEPDGIGQTQIDDVEALVALREEMAPFVIDDAHLAEDVAGEVLDHGIAEGGKHGAIAFGDRHVLGARAQRERGRNAAAELRDEGLGRLFDHVGIVHRQEAEIGRVLGRQIANDADRPVAVDVESEIGVGRHLRQIETGVVGEAGREMQIGARIGLEKAERRSALVDFLRVGKLARVGNALVVVDREAAQPQGRRGDEMAAEGDEGERRIGQDRALSPRAEAPRRGTPRTTAPAAPR